MLLIRIIIIVTFLLPALRAEDAYSAANLQRLSAAIAKLESQLGSLLRERNKLEQEQRLYQDQRRLLESSGMELSDQTAQVAAQRSQMLQDLEQTELDMRSLRARLLSRLKALYLYQQHRYGMLTALSSDQVARNSQVRLYTRRLQSYDEQLLDKMRSKHRERERSVRSLEETEGRYQSLLATQREEADRVERLLADLHKLASEIAQRERDSRQTLQKLTAQKSQVERVLEQMLRPRGRSSFLPGLTKYTNWPVDGQLVRPYGKYRLRGLAEELLHKGVSFATRGDSPVRALDAGVVKFVGEMPSYGLMVILHHGDRDYSLYGGLESADVNLGDLLKQSMILGRSRGADGQEGDFYFEVRRAGEALNPQMLIEAKVL